jgi:HlyD family type I secretion membrane fusion protein
MKKIELTDVIFYTIGLFFIVFMLWANYAEIDQVVRAEAQVEPATKVQKIQSRYPGSVQSIDVEVGDLVEKDQVLLRMDKTESLLVFNVSKQQIELIKEEQKIFEPLVTAGIEPKIRLIKMKQQLLEATEKMQRHQLQLNHSDIKSPVKGIVTAVHVVGEGSVLKGGEVLIEVVPEADYFVVKAKILPKDISKVSVGQNSRVSFTAYDFSRYGVMEGVVTKIAQNTTKTQQGEIYYEAWIRTHSSKFSKSDIKPNILPGMIAQVDLLGEKRTIIEYISSPLNRAASRALTEQ